MGERKMKDLQSIHKKLEMDGKELDPNQQIMYDLSVLINKYDSYLKWLEKQRIIEMERDRSNLDNASIQQIVDPNIQKNMAKKDDIDEFDLAQLVDEIFD